MTNLIKINLLTFLDFYKIRNAKNKQELLKSLRGFIFIILGLGVLSFTIFTYLKQTMEAYIALKIPYIILAQVFALVSSFTLFTGIYKVNGVLFGFKDYDLLMSLPIKKNKVILSKIIILYISNLIYTLLFMLPAYILYITNINVDLAFHILFFITLLIIPILPIVISTIVGSIIVIISSKFKIKKLMQILLTIMLMIGILFLSYKLENTNTYDLANIGKTMVEMFNKIYPLTNLYIEIINNYNIKSLLLFIFIPLLIMFIFIKIIEYNFIDINNALIKESVKSNYKMKELKQNGILLTLYKKEIKKYFSSVNYVLNTAIGSILLTLSVISLVVFGKGKIDAILGIEGLSEMFIKYGPIIFGSFCLLSCTTHPSISLEGKNVWILKSSPIKPIEIFISKIMVNLTILIPTILINMTILSIYLKTSFKTYILSLIIPILCSIFTSIMGIILNCFFINYEYKNEIQIIKQSAPAFISIFIGFVSFLLPFNIDIDLSKHLNELIIGLLVADIIIYIFMKHVSSKQFKDA